MKLSKHCDWPITQQNPDWQGPQKVGVEVPTETTIIATKRNTLHLLSLSSWHSALVPERLSGLLWPTCRSLVLYVQVWWQLSDRQHAPCHGTSVIISVQRNAHFWSFTPDTPVRLPVWHTHSTLVQCTVVTTHTPTFQQKYFVYFPVTGTKTNAHKKHPYTWCSNFGQKGVYYVGKYGFLRTKRPIQKQVRFVSAKATRHPLYGLPPNPHGQSEEVLHNDDGTHNSTCACRAVFSLAWPINNTGQNQHLCSLKPLVGFCWEQLALCLFLNKQNGVQKKSQLTTQDWTRSPGEGSLQVRNKGLSQTCLLPKFNNKNKTNITAKGSPFFVTCWPLWMYLQHQIFQRPLVSLAFALRENIGITQHFRPAFLPFWKPIWQNRETMTNTELAFKSLES